MQRKQQDSPGTDQYADEGQRLLNAVGSVCDETAKLMSFRCLSAGEMFIMAFRQNWKAISTNFIRRSVISEEAAVSGYESVVNHWGNETKL